MLNQPRQVLEGAWQITLPLPFELNHVNVYLVRLNDGWMLIDTGLATAASFEELSAQLAFLGVEWSAITEIFLTHTHPDHVGQARRLLAITGARLSLQTAELDQVNGLARDGEAPFYGTMRQAGVPDELLDRIAASFERIRVNFQKLSPDRLLHGTEVMETAVGPLQLVLTPGHSPGHLCLYSEQHRTLFAGDHVLERITPNIGWLSGRDALGDFIRSLDRVKPLEIEQILPGHGVPFSGHRPWIDQTKAHHDERCEQILSSLAAGPRSAHSLVGDLWVRPLAPFHHRFAVYEVLAHLEFLRQRDRVWEEPLAAHAVWRV